jgi:hypothetical protein
MGRTKTVLNEIWRLFVDDGNLALAVVIWLAIAWLVASLLPGGPWDAILLFIGVALILVESVWRRARR